jgi:hypothetical protein
VPDAQTGRIDWFRRRPAGSATTPTDPGARSPVIGGREAESAVSSSHRPLVTWLTVGLATSICAQFVMVGADARWLAALGRVIAHTRSIPSGIPYAAAPSGHWTNVPVLGELVFHALEAAGGDRALLVVQVVAVAMALTLLAIDLRPTRAPDAVRALILVAVVFAAAPALFIARAQLFSLVLFPAVVVIVRREARNPSRGIWLLLPVFALWANLHGAVLIGLAVAAAYLVLDRMRREPVVALGVLVASIGTLFLTPALARSADYYLGVVRSEVARRGVELWAPLSLHAPLDLLFLVVAVPLVVLALRSRPPLWELVCVAGLAASTVHVGRNSVWLVLFLATPAARGVRKVRLVHPVPARRVVLACAGVTALLLVGGLIRSPARHVAGGHLRDQAAALAAGAPILADDLDAEQLALDGRLVWIGNPIDAFNRRDQGQYLDWLAGKPGGDLALHQGERVVLVKRGSAPQRRLSRDADFRAVAHDQVAVLYVLNRVAPQ